MKEEVEVLGCPTLIDPTVTVDVKQRWRKASSQSEPAWPSGKWLGWLAEGPRFNSASAFLSLQKQSVDTVL